MLHMAHSIARGMVLETAKAGHGAKTEDTAFRKEISWKTSAALGDYKIRGRESLQ
jgi:hypothetical protein